MRLKTFVWAGALASALLLAGCSGKSDAESLKSAKAFLDKREYKSATIELKALLQKSPSSGEARFLLGKALVGAGDMAGAEAELERALEYKYSAEAVAPVLAKALLTSRQFRKLTDRYARFEVADFKDAVDLKVSVALAFAAQGQKDEARAAVERALSINPASPEALTASARLQAGEGKVDEALQTLDALLAKEPETALAWQLKGDLLLHAKSQLPEAEAAYRKAIEIRKDLPDAHAALITMAFRQKDFDAAGSRLDELKKIAPSHPQTLFFDAQLAFARTDYARARELLQGLLRAAPENVRLLHLAGATELRLNSLSHAESLLGNAVKLAPNFIGARRVLAQVYLRMREPAKAQAVLRPVVESRAADSESLSLMGQAAAMLGDGKAADDYFGRAAKLKPDDHRIRAAQALGQVARGNAEAGFSELETLAADDKGSAIDLAIISAHLRRNEVDKALKAIDTLEKKQPDSPVAPNLRGRVQLQKKDLAGARKSFEQALARDAKFVPAAAALAAMDLSAKKPDDAKARFQSVLKADPKNAQAMLAMAGLLIVTHGPNDQIVKWISDAIQAEPANPLARMALVDHHLKTHNNKAALSAAQTAVAAMPDDTLLLERLARAQVASGETQQALSSLAKVTQLRPNSAAGFMTLGELQLNSNEVDAAARSAAKALELEPTSARAQRLSLAVSMKQQKPREAIALARQIQSRQPKDSVGFLAEGEIELELKNYDSAIAAFRKATTLSEPGPAAARMHHAMLRAKRDAEAAKFADSWIAGHPKDAVFLFYLGDVALGQGNSSMAERRYSEVLKIQPENTLALNNVAWLMAQQKRAGAVALAERAVNAAPDQAPLLDTLALALAAESQLPRALEVQKQAVDLKPDTPIYRLNLAKLQLQAGDKAAAREELEKLAKLGAKFGQQAEVERLLKSAAGS